MLQFYFVEEAQVFLGDGDIQKNAKAGESPQKVRVAPRRNYGEQRQDRGRRDAQIRERLPELDVAVLGRRQRRELGVNLLLKDVGFQIVRGSQGPVQGLDFPELRCSTRRASSSREVARRNAHKKARGGAPPGSPKYFSHCAARAASDG
jgi:hypothetical protein